MKSLSIQIVVALVAWPNCVELLVERRLLRADNGANLVGNTRWIAATRRSLVARAARDPKKEINLFFYPHNKMCNCAVAAKVIPSIRPKAVNRKIVIWTQIFVPLEREYDKAIGGRAAAVDVGTIPMARQKRF